MTTVGRTANQSPMKLDAEQVPLTA